MEIFSVPTGYLTDIAIQIILSQLMLGVVENLLCITLLNDFTEIHEDDVVGNTLSLT